MNENVFTVDLGDMKLTDAQRKEINAAIQTATTTVLAKTGASNGFALFPIYKLPKGPIINGIVARNLKGLKLDQQVIFNQLG